MEQKVDKKPDLNEITQRVLEALDARSKDIIMRRFGLASEDPETLESIGRQYGITRERVRQIEANAKRTLASLSEVLEPAQQMLVDLFIAHGGALVEPHIVALLQKESGRVHQNVVHFHLEITPHFHYHTQSPMLKPHWRYDVSLQPAIDAIAHSAMEVLKETNHPLHLDQLIQAMREHLTEKGSIPDAHIAAVILASKNLGKTAFEDWGLVGWAETSPRGVGDKAYAVLRRHKKPAHFREITDLINEARFDHKKANPQTVHNELIKDTRFVLVGRGLYGLKEWGYVSGTVADVLESILRKTQEPLTREELVDAVLEQRLVKKNTILLSLQNTKRFEKTPSNRYKLRSK